MKFLIDECLSPDLVHTARTLGFDASMHVTWPGLGSRNDCDIATRAIADDYVLVTNNTKDFLRIYRKQPIHPGLICINAALRLMGRTVQNSLFRYGLKFIDHEPVNEVLEVSLRQDQTIEVVLYDWP